jgi:hypothetical protein
VRASFVGTRGKGLINFAAANRGTDRVRWAQPPTIEQVSRLPVSKPIQLAHEFIQKFIRAG